MLSRWLIQIFLIFCLLTSAQADLQKSVKKYQGISIPPALMKKTRKYDHLVRYFSSFSYFKPYHKVSPEFIHALILAESAGNPRAISNKNALGLGQIILTTAQSAGKELADLGYNFKYVSQRKLKNLKKHDLFNPAINILLTCYLISKYNHKFDGRIELVLSAWNAGEYTEQLKYKKHAPYSETENLIGKVNGYYLYLLKNR